MDNQLSVQSRTQSEVDALKEQLALLQRQFVNQQDAIEKEHQELEEARMQATADAEAPSIALELQRRRNDRGRELMLQDSQNLKEQVADAETQYKTYVAYYQEKMKDQKNRAKFLAQQKDQLQSLAERDMRIS